MSVKHYSTDQHTLWWQQQQRYMDASAETSWFSHHNEEVLSKNPNYNGQKVPLFAKPLTPSDVGKLNRLVIPKQHAEKYFPLNGASGTSAAGGGGGAAVAEKGLILSFEDEEGKLWHFRYSYWNSSQSYVLTKGWSRYVKEKQLEAGDVVYFQRDWGVGDGDGPRLFIGRRRSGEASVVSLPPAGQETFNNMLTFYGGSWIVPYPFVHQAHVSCIDNPLYQPEYFNAGATAVVDTRTPTSAAVGNAKTVRLFGVNLECQLDDHNGSSHGSSAPPHHFYPPRPFPSPPNTCTNISSSKDINQMENRRG